MKENKINHRQLLKTKDAIAYLETITRCLKEGRIVIEREGQFVSFNTPDLIHLELSAKDKKEKSEISIELSWRKEPFMSDIAQLSISSIEPPAPESVEENKPAEAKKEDKKEVDKKEAVVSPKADIDEKPRTGTSKAKSEADKTGSKPPSKSK